MTFEEACKPYEDEDGLMIERLNRSDGPETGNGIRELCIREIIRFKRGEYSESLLQNFRRILQNCQVPGYPGLYHRGPRKTEEAISHDDYRALSACAYLLGAGFNKDIAGHGQKHRWSFNNLEPEQFTLGSWHGRFPGLVALYRLNAGLNYILGATSVSISLLLASMSSRPNSWILSWFTVVSVEGRACGFAVDHWRRMLLKRFPGGMSEVFSKYYEDGADHPFAAYFPKG